MVYGSEMCCKTEGVKAVLINGEETFDRGVWASNRKQHGELEIINKSKELYNSGNRF